MTQTVVILGGSLGGLGVTHRLLKYTLPHVPDLKVILITKNTHFYWNVASIRAVIKGVLTDDQILQPIEPGLAQYPSGSVSFILGEATRLDTSSKQVHVSSSSSSSSLSNRTSDTTTAQVIPYDYLVIATGSTGRCPSLPWKASSTHEACLEALHSTRDRISSASHIVIAGAGPTGVELAGEIRFAYPAKHVILLCAEEQLLGGDCIASAAERELVKLGVQIRKRARVASADDKDKDTHGENNSAAKTVVKLKLQDGEELETELYLPTMGFVPNTGYLPSEWLDERRCVQVDEHMGVVEGTWAVGDAVSRPRAGYLFTEAQAAGVARNIDLVLRGKQQQPVHGPPLDIFICSTGRSRAAGRFGHVPIPSLAAWIGKGRTLGIDRTRKYADGSMW